MRNILVGAVTGFGAYALTKESLAAGADKMRSLMIKDSSTFAGVGDSTGKVLNNQSGESAGINGGGVTVGGTRVDLDGLCGPINVWNDLRRGTRSIQDLNNPKDRADIAKESDMGYINIDEQARVFVQSLFEAPYDAGPHDMIGGKLSGLYDEQGNIKRGMSGSEAALYDRWSELAIPIALPCAAAHPA